MRMNCTRSRRMNVNLFLVTNCGWQQTQQQQQGGVLSLNAFSSVHCLMKLLSPSTYSINSVISWYAPKRKVKCDSMSQRTNTFGTNMESSEEMDTTWYRLHRITVFERNCFGVLRLRAENCRQKRKNVRNVAQEAMARQAINGGVMPWIKYFTGGMWALQSVLVSLFVRISSNRYSSEVSLAREGSIFTRFSLFNIFHVMH